MYDKICYYFVQFERFSEKQSVSKSELSNNLSNNLENNDSKWIVSDLKIRHFENECSIDPAKFGLRVSKFPRVFIF